MGFFFFFFFFFGKKDYGEIFRRDTQICYSNQLLLTILHRKCHKKGSSCSAQRVKNLSSASDFTYLGFPRLAFWLHNITLTELLTTFYLRTFTFSKDISLNIGSSTGTINDSYFFEYLITNICGYFSYCCLFL